jgi:hypothetical protein
LSYEQQASLEAALLEGSPKEPPTPHEQVSLTMAALNCCACHSRDGVGGPTTGRNELFRTTIPEMGDEGRVPPPLDGVGDKLNDRYLRQILDKGADDRAYMLTQMPRFGREAAGHLAEAFAKLDRRHEMDPAEFDEPDHRVKSTGRELVGEKGLACIKCHSFGPHRATGIQAMNLQAMTSRLREDWFLRYLIDPNAYRPGTRMPTGFPEGQASVRTIYDGDASKQTTAIWEYLSDGDRAGMPDGLIAQLQELVPKERPILYRNFIEGLSPRGIAVGYPEKGHLAWDANRMALALIWHGRFIDASMHWNGRGQGFQRPLGDHVILWERAPAVAALKDEKAPWPGSDARGHGYSFHGYELDAQGRPAFLYSGEGFDVRDFAEPVPRNDDEGVFRRRVTITAGSPIEGLWFRAGRGKQIAAHPEGGWLVDGAVHVQVESAQPARLREIDGAVELIVPLDLSSGQADVVQTLEW